MKSGMKVLAGFLLASVWLAMPAPAAQADAGKARHTVNADTSRTITDFSAAKRKKKNAISTPSVVTSPGATWTGPDPTKGPGVNRIREQQFSRCVMDEGYGRFTYCM